MYFVNFPKTTFGDFPDIFERLLTPEYLLHSLSYVIGERQ
jgi:hypothetical protein